MSAASGGLAGALAELYARVPRGMRLDAASLDAMNEVCARAGHPERAFEAVHVAGTNGKGSVCAMVESIARAAGRKTGLYTSPHLVKFAERIRIDGEPLSDAALESVLQRALDLGPDLSFFETATLAAFLAFAEARVDLAIVEVGIGGRLDATNVLPSPRVTAITRIALDHIDKLGETLPEIAREKAGIAKPGVPLVLGALDAESHAAIEEVARAKGARVIEIEPAFASSFRSLADLPLRGAHQRGNGEVAIAVAHELGIEDAAIEAGLRATRWPGRLERVDRPDGPYLLDGAHNPDGATALASYIQREVPALALVFGALADKSWMAMLDLLAPLTPHRVYVAPQGRAAAPPAALAARHAGQLAESLPDALARARAAVGAGVVVVCGSLYLVGEARALLLGLPGDPIVAL
jgi:dihydrofolate synthase/folylpolyglutamate synthase